MIQKHPERNMVTGARNHQERKKEKIKHKPPVSTSMLLQTLSEYKKLEAETMKFSSHILFLLGLHFNQAHWQSSCGPGMTSIKVREQGRGGSGRSMQEEKWGDGVKDRGSIVKVLTDRWWVREV